MEIDLLIARSTGGDADALELLLRRYRKWMLTIVEHKASADLLRLYDPKEIVQHAQGHSFRSIGKLVLGTPPRASFEAWLRTVTINAVRYFGRKRRIRLLELDSAVAPSDPGPAASQMHRRTERLERLSTAIAGLPAHYREVIELQLRGMTLVEIASQLGQARATVNSRLERARARLHELLGSTSLNLS